MNNMDPARPAGSTIKIVTELIPSYELFLEFIRWHPLTAEE